MRHILEIKTPRGELFAEISQNPDYPGFWICLRRGDIEMPLALVECENIKEEDISVISTKVWGDDQEDYTHKIIHTKIEEFFRYMEESGDR